MMTFNSSDGAAGDVTADSALSGAAARATVFARVVSLMNGRSGLRPEVLTFFCGMLNNGITPLLPKEGGEGPALAKAVLGAGSCLFKGEVRCVLLPCLPLFWGRQPASQPTYLSLFVVASASTEVSHFGKGTPIHFVHTMRLFFFTFLVQLP